MLHKSESAINLQHFYITPPAISTVGYYCQSHLTITKLSKACRFAVGVSVRWPLTCLFKALQEKFILGLFYVLVVQRSGYIQGKCAKNILDLEQRAKVVFFENAIHVSRR